MSTARVTSKGQVTIPADVRRALKIDQGDDLAFEVTSERSAEVKVLKRKRLSDLFGALPSDRPVAGKEATRDEIGRELGKALQEKKA